MTDRDQGNVEYRGSGFYVSVVMILLIGLVLFIFALQNTQDVLVTLLGVEFEIPLFGVAIGAGLVTVMLDQLVGLVWRRQRRRRLEERQELARLRAETAMRDEFDQPYADEPVDEDSETGATP